MKTTDTLIISGSIIFAGCIIAFAMHRSGDVSPVASLSAPTSTPAAVSTATPVTPVKEEDKLAGKWREIDSWGGLLGTLQLAPDGTGKFTSPPYSVKCKWSLPESGKIKTETENPQEGAPGVFGDTNTTRVWKYAFADKDRLDLTLEGGDEKISYQRAPAGK